MAVRVSSADTRWRCGDLGQPPDGWPPAIQAKVLKGESPCPGDRLAPVDLEAARGEAVAKIGRPASAVSDDDLASYLMYPKIFVDYAKAAEIYGPTSVLPTPTYFCGVHPGDELHIEIERGKTIVVLCQAIGETDEEGKVKVFSS